MRTLAWLVVSALLHPPGALAASDREVYRAACAACHGLDGTGAPPERRGFALAPPDFTDCSFATREADADWIAVTHEGGPARGFDRRMPAFGDALTDAEIQQAIDHVRTFCDEPRWPRGELNFPRAMYTEKAFPEDEWFLRNAVSTGDRAALDGTLVYEWRVGARNQLEVIVPYGVSEAPADAEPGDDALREGIGDVGFGAKRVLASSLRTGSIASVSAELFLPTGDATDGYGRDTTAVEAWLAYGQQAPLGLVLQAQGGVELPFDTHKAPNEAFVRGALSRSIVPTRFGRVWTPIVELLVADTLDDDLPARLDVVPQLHVTLPRRQHVRANLAVRIPVADDEEPRDAQIALYLLWDWFDGGLFEGW